MRFWGKFLKIIYKPFLFAYKDKIEAFSFEGMLKKAVELFDEETRDEIRQFLKWQFTKENAFADKAGKGDIYYSLFGLWMAEALGMEEFKTPLKNFVIEKIQTPIDTDVHVFCLAILYAKLEGEGKYTEPLCKQVREILERDDQEQFQYLNFMGMLALFYLQDFTALRKLLKKYDKLENDKEAERPCTLVAADCILKKLSRKDISEELRILETYHKGNGGFVTLEKSPIADLLTTAVALYTMRICDSELRGIKALSMDYVDSLYVDGGFCATLLDHKPDVEYSFYGLLALGALVD